MKNISFLFASITFCSILLMTSCKKDDSTSPPARTYQDIVNDFNAIDITVEKVDTNLEFQSGNFWDFRVLSPSTQSGVTYPLLIDLHGASGI